VVTNVNSPFDISKADLQQAKTIFEVFLPRYKNYFNLVLLLSLLPLVAAVVFVAVRVGLGVVEEEVAAAVSTGTASGRPRRSSRYSCRSRRLFQSCFDIVIVAVVVFAVIVVVVGSSSSSSLARG